MQLDNWIYVADPLAELALAMAGSRGVEVDGNAVSAANFMSDGTAYVFDVTPDADRPTPKLVISR